MILSSGRYYESPRHYGQRMSGILIDVRRITDPMVWQCGVLRSLMCLSHALLMNFAVLSPFLVGCLKENYGQVESIEAIGARGKYRI